MPPGQRTASFQLCKTVGSTSLWRVRGTPAHAPFFYEAGVIIDLDGAPKAYAPRGSGLVGLDRLGNAVAIRDKSGRSPWLVPPADQTDTPTNPQWTPTYASTVRDPKTGASIVQASGPARGYYISESSLKNIYAGRLRGPQTDPDYQTDATIYPYIVLPPKLLHAGSSVQVGDYAFAIHGASGRYTFAQFGDAKNKPIMGEASSALAQNTGDPARPRWRDAARSRLCRVSQFRPRPDIPRVARRARGERAPVAGVLQRPHRSRAADPALLHAGISRRGPRAAAARVLRRRSAVYRRYK